MQHLLDESAAHFNYPTTSFMAKSSFLLTAKHCAVTTASIDTGTTTQLGTTGHLDARGPRRGPTQSKAHVFNYSGLVRKIDL